MNPTYEMHCLKIERPIYEQNELQQAMEYKKPARKVCSNVNCNSWRPKKFLLNSIPALKWLPKYKWKRDLVNDLIAGFTVTVMQIPQGMAYALLGKVPPIVGIYMAFFPIIIYFLLGTSRHNSMGTFAVVCLMVGKVITEHTEENLSANILTSNVTIYSEQINKYTPTEIAITVTFVTGIFQLIMYSLRLGVVANLLSEPLVIGFTTGCAVHVFISQIKDLFDLQLSGHKGAFEVIHTTINIFQEISNLNIVATIMSSITIIICAGNELIKPHVKKISSFPVPAELMVVVTATLISSNWNFKEVYSIKIVGAIPSGLPSPILPDFSLVGTVACDSIIIAIVAYTIALSMALIFAQRLSYDVDANQELLAQGIGNVFGSFFSCMPISASLSRSLIQESVGGKTQLASLISCFIIFFVLIWIGPFFEPLPKCVLASVIIVALKGMFMQAVSLKKIWSLSKLDGIVWIITFLGVVILNVDVGLLIGFIVSLLSMMILSMKPYTCLLGSVPNTDLYVDISRYVKAKEIPSIKIFQYCGGINFATRNYFKNELYRLVGVNPQKEAARRKKLLKRSANMDGIDNAGYENNIYSIEDKIPKNSSVNILKYIIIDFSSVAYIDPSAIALINLVAQDFKKIDVIFFIADCSSPVFEMTEKCELKKNLTDLKIFPTIHDAVESINSKIDITSL